MPGPLSKVFERQLTPEEALRNAPSGAIVDLLARLIAQTQQQPYGKQPRAGVPTPTPSSVGERMRGTPGPVKAGTAKRIASERDAMLKKVYEE